VVCSLGSGFITSDLIRAVLEGILFSVYSIYIALRDLAGEARRFVLVALPFMAKMMTDVFACDVLIQRFMKLVALGAMQCLHLVPSTIWLMCNN